MQFAATTTAGRACVHTSLSTQAKTWSGYMDFIYTMCVHNNLSQGLKSLGIQCSIHVRRRIVSSQEAAHVKTLFMGVYVCIMAPKHACPWAHALKKISYLKLHNATHLCTHTKLSQTPCAFRSAPFYLSSDTLTEIPM
jgi:hypothetical protein